MINFQNVLESYDLVNKKSESVNYQMVYGERVSQNQRCRAIAFNKAATFMVASCDREINVFEFNFGHPKLIQSLNEHTSYVYSLYFMKLSNKFISGSQDTSIRIWGLNKTQQWYCNDLLEGHSDTVTSVIMNKAEDLLISGSHDASIKIWAKNKGWVCSSTLTNHNGVILCLSLNDSENQLVSYGEDQQIFIFQLDRMKKIQRIQIMYDEQGQRLCTIGDNFITFQPQNGQNMLIFKLNKETKQFNMSNKVAVDTFYNGCSWLFPQVFNKQKQILLNKNGETVYLIKKYGENDFRVDQSFKFGTEYIWGAITENGEFLVTWDEFSKQYQVRKCQQ